MKRTILLTSEDELHLAEITQQHPFSTRHAIARIALHVGIRELRRNPELLLTEIRADQVQP